MSAAKIGIAVMVALGCWSGVAAADEAPAPASPPPAKKGEITIQVKIYGRRQVPSASIDVARLVPRAPLPELRKPLVDRIANAVDNAPF